MKRLTGIALALALSASLAQAGTASPKRELRQTWFTTHVNIDWPSTKGTSSTVIAKQKSTLLTYLDGFEKMNLNGICFQVRAQSDAVYKSSYEPWSAVMTGTRGTDPGWDPLAYAVEECHKRGLECWAWINPYRWSTGTDYNTPQDKEFKSKGWILNYGSYYVLNPALPEVREHILKVCKEIVDNYALDGVLFDDYFYPNNIPEGSTAGDWTLYKNSGTTMSIGDWRRENINIFVREFQKMIEESHPDMRFGISPAGVAGASASKFGVTKPPVSASDWQYNTIYSDPLAWLNDGSIDFISPQIYWTTSHSTAPYEPLCKWWTSMAEHFGRHFYSSHSVSFLNGANTSANWSEVATQVKLNRKYAEPTEENAPGSIYFSSKYFYGPTCTGLGDHLLNNVYKTKSLIPIIDWKKRVTFSAPQNIKFDGTKLTWTAINAPKSIMRYTVYAIPSSVSLDDAMEADGDGISNDYLLKVCYDTSFTLPADKQSGYWYAVCAYDGLGYEYEPAVANYAEGVSTKVNLVSPANGAKVAWNQAFSWTAGATCAEYTVRIATDAAFSDVVLTSDRIATTSTTLDLGDLNPTTTYYWQVLCFEPNKIRATSDSRTFVTPAYTNAPAVTLLSPADGYDAANGTVEFKWTAASGVSSYTLEVADKNTFAESSIRYTTTLDANTTSLKINTSLIGKGEFYWHVTTQGKHLIPTASESRKLIISKLTIGLTEPGYAIKKDPATYATKEGVVVENLWMRSITDDFKNINFTDNGMLERSMVALGDYVYLTKRSENSTGAILTLEKYDGLTGEHVSTIKLGDEAGVAFYPLNTVMRDDAGHILVSNLSLNATTTPVYVHMVNLNDGSLTEVAKIQFSGLSAARVDHVAVTGDAAAGNFVVWMAFSSTANVGRVTFVNGKQTEIKTAGFTTFYPSTCSTFGIAAHVTPLGNNEMYINGGGTGLGRFNFDTRKLVDSFDNATSDVRTGATTANGSAHFKLGSKYYTVYPARDHSDSGFRFDILRGDEDNFVSAKKIASVPEAGLGSINSSTASTPVSWVVDSDGLSGSARVYVYAVGNGLSAYKLNDLTSGVNTVAVDAANEDAVWYTIGGVQLESAPTIPGMYIRLDKTTGKAVRQVVK